MLAHKIADALSAPKTNGLIRRTKACLRIGAAPLKLYDAPEQIRGRSSGGLDVDCKTHLGIEHPTGQQRDSWICSAIAIERLAYPALNLTEAQFLRERLAQAFVELGNSLSATRIARQFEPIRFDGSRARHPRSP